MQPVAVVIPNWNGATLLERFLPSVAAQTARPAKVLVVDNGSTDGSRECAARHGAEILALGQNFGFAAAVNRGAGHWKNRARRSHVEKFTGWTRKIYSMAHSICWPEAVVRGEAEPAGRTAWYGIKDEM
jgi:glycosyltransferase involved in cell wall biosynthesis